jgi:hypothetical protein
LTEVSRRRRDQSGAMAGWPHGQIHWNAGRRLCHWKTAARGAS